MNDLLTKPGPDAGGQRNTFLEFGGDPLPEDAEAIRLTATEVIGRTDQMLVLNCSQVRSVREPGLDILRHIQAAAAAKSIDVVLSEAVLPLRQALVRARMLDVRDLRNSSSSGSVVLVRRC